MWEACERCEIHRKFWSECGTGKKPLGQSKYALENNIEIDLKEVVLKAVD
jgi:hypothetical protein